MIFLELQIVTIFEPAVIVNHYMNPNITSIPLEGSNQIQVGWVKRNDVLLPEELLVYIDFLKSALEKSMPKDIKEV
ncbi:hypothetical protein [Neobacillus sp. Marseille-QA0830]